MGKRKNHYSSHQFIEPVTEAIKNTTEKKSKETQSTIDAI